MRRALSRFVILCSLVIACCDSKKSKNVSSVSTPQENNQQNSSVLEQSPIGTSVPLADPDEVVQVDLASGAKIFPILVGTAKEPLFIGASKQPQEATDIVDLKKNVIGRIGGRFITAVSGEGSRILVAVRAPISCKAEEKLKFLQRPCVISDKTIEVLPVAIYEVNAPALGSIQFRLLGRITKGPHAFTVEGLAPMRRAADGKMRVAIAIRENTTKKQSKLFLERYQYAEVQLVPAIAPATQMKRTSKNKPKKIRSLSEVALQKDLNFAKKGTLLVEQLSEGTGKFQFLKSDVLESGEEVLRYVFSTDKQAISSVFLGQYPAHYTNALRFPLRWVGYNDIKIEEIISDRVIATAVLASEKKRVIVFLKWDRLAASFHPTDDSITGPVFARRGRNGQLWVASMSNARPGLAGGAYTLYCEGINTEVSAIMAPYCMNRQGHPWFRASTMSGEYKKGMVFPSVALTDLQVVFNEKGNLEFWLAGNATQGSSGKAVEASYFIRLHLREM